jgi:hypothetical protein
VQSASLAAQFEERFSEPAAAVSGPGTVLTGFRRRARGRVLAAFSPLL